MTDRAIKIVIGDDLTGSAPPHTEFREAHNASLTEEQVHGAAVVLARALRPLDLAGGGLTFELTVVSESGLSQFGYVLANDQVTLNVGALPDADVRLTLQKSIDLAYMLQGTPVLAIVASGRGALVGTLEQVHAVFGQADLPALEGRRAFKELADLLIAASAQSAKVDKLLDGFGRADFALELVHLFADASFLSGMLSHLASASLRFSIGGLAWDILMSPEGCDVVGPRDVDPDAIVEVPKMTTMVDRMLGRTGDMDAILSRKVLVSGEGVDDLMPLFEQISTGLTALTSSLQRSW